MGLQLVPFQSCLQQEHCCLLKLAELLAVCVVQLLLGSAALVFVATVSNFMHASQQTAKTHFVNCACTQKVSQVQGLGGDPLWTNTRALCLLTMRQRGWRLSLA